MRPPSPPGGVTAKRVKKPSHDSGSDKESGNGAMIAGIAGGVVVGGIAGAAAMNYMDNQSKLEEEMRIKGE